MTSLLTAFFMYHANADWWWWALWCIFAFGSLVKVIREL
jgi:hypothetical protein